MGRRAKKRDDVEAAIVAALEAAGASVAKVDDDDGAPDLIVGYNGATELLEVKSMRAGGRTSKGGNAQPSAGGDGVSTARQLEWRARWRGKPPVIVSTPAEALAAVMGADAAAIGARVADSALDDPLPRIPRRKSGMVTSDEAAQILTSRDDRAACAAAGHPKVAGALGQTGACVCGTKLTRERAAAARASSPCPRLCKCGDHEGVHALGGHCNVMGCKCKRFREHKGT